MPLGRVFDATANQVTAEPVTSFYKGKLLRNEIARGEKDLEQADKKLELDERRVEVGEAELGLRERQMDAKQEELQRGYSLHAAAASMQAYEATEGTEEEKREAAFEAGIAVFDEYLPGGREDVIKHFEEQGKPIGPGAFDPNATRALLMDSDLYKDVQKANLKQTEQQKLIEGLPISREDKDELLKKIAVKAGTVTGTTEFDPQSDPRTNSQRGAAYQQNIDEYNSSSDVQELITSALPQVAEMPGAVGVKGKIGQGGAGLLMTLGQAEMADAFAEYMAGASQEEIAQIQTQLQAIRGRIIPIVTGEQGKRLSETEREIGSRAVGLIDNIQGPADLTKAYPQVMGALRQLYAESWATKYRLASREEGISYPYDLSNRDEMIELFTEFSEAGVDIDTAKRTIIRLKSIQGVE